MPESFLRIAGITLAIRSDDPRIDYQFDAPVSRFVVDPAPPDVELQIEVLDDYQPPRGPLLFDSGAVWRMYAEGDGVRIECQADPVGVGPYKVATFNRDFTRGTIRMITPATVDPLQYPLDELLIANLLGRGRGVELHGCGVIDADGRGHLFVGQSGAGKTTTARLWADDAKEIVSDDRVIVREDGDGMRMFGTPWHGEAEMSSPTSAPLAAVYLLQQWSGNELCELPPAAAVARLFSCTFPMFHDPAAIGFTMSMLDRIVSCVPVRELRFTIDRAAVDLVRGRA